MQSVVTKTEPMETFGFGAPNAVGKNSWLVLLSLSFFLFYIFRKQKQAQFRKMRVPFVGHCNFLLGNLADFAKMPIHQLHRHWTKLYGKTYGYFEGPAPILITSDLQILQEVLIKQFPNFSARKDIPLVPDSDTHPYVHTFIAEGARWKRLRQCSGAFFTTGRLRALQNVITLCADNLANELKASTATPLDIFDVISKEVYELQQLVLKGNVDKGENGMKTRQEALELMKESLDSSKVPAIVVFGLLFPEVKFFWLRMYYMLNKIKLQQLPGYELFYHVKRQVPQILKTVEPSSTQAPTMLEYYSKLVTDFREAPLQHATFRPELSYSEMVTEFFVSYFTQPTFSLSLSMCLYLLAKHPHVQKRLQAEIDCAFPIDSDADAEGSREKLIGLDYDKVTQMPYLNMVINEVFRMYPVFQVINRLCVASTRVADLDIPAGVTVQPDVWSIHYDPEVWGEDAKEFNPERFSPENMATRHPLALLTFGAGPRMCFGRRFVLLHMKTLLCVLLRQFTVQPHDQGLKSMPLDMDTIDLDMVSPKEKIFVSFVPR